MREAVDVGAHRRNRIVTGSGAGSTRLLGLIAPDLTNPFFTELAEQIESEARRRGYSLIAASSMSDQDLEREHTRDLESRRVEAVLIASVLHPSEVKSTRSHQVRAVYIEDSWTLDGVNRVGADLERGTEAAVDHLLSHGHETVAILSGLLSDPTRRDVREIAWARVLAGRGCPGGRIIRSELTRRGAWRAMAEVIAAGRVPSAIFATSDLQAIGALRALHEAGLRVPEDVALIGFDGIEGGQFCWPTLTTVRQPVDQMAVAIVDAALRYDDFPVRRTFTSHIVIRRSCGCEPAP